MAKYCSQLAGGGKCIIGVGREMFQSFFWWVVMVLELCYKAVLKFYRKGFL